jgi:hypothetical protein
VQEWLPDEESEVDDQTYCMMGCRACGGVHLVSPATARVLRPVTEGSGFFDFQTIGAVLKSKLGLLLKRPCTDPT